MAYESKSNIPVKMMGLTENYNYSDGRTRKKSKSREKRIFFLGPAFKYFYYEIQVELGHLKTKNL